MPLRNSSRRRVPTTAAAGVPAPLVVPVLEQEQDEWCWAACMVMVLRYRGDHTTEQCQLAAIRTGNSLCCADPSVCDCPCPVQKATEIYVHLGLQVTTAPGAPPFSTFASEFASSRPVQIGTSVASNGHALVVTWAGPLDTGPHLRLIDPLFPAVVVWPYATVQNTAMATWTGL